MAIKETATPKLAWSHAVALLVSYIKAGFNVMLTGMPGVGKTASINEVCKIYLKEEGTCVVIWDTSSIRSSVVSKFFLSQSNFHKSVKKMIFIIEDIAGGQ